LAAGMGYERGFQKITDTFPSSSAMLHKEVYENNVADFDFWLVKIPSASQGSVDNILKPRFAQKVQCHLPDYQRFRVV
jgi:hypothetical protein